MWSRRIVSRRIMRHAQPTRVRRAQEKPHDKFIFFWKRVTDYYPARGRVQRADGANQKMKVAATQMADMKVCQRPLFWWQLGVTGYSESLEKWSVKNSPINRFAV